MTVLEWLEASTMYSSFTEKNFVKIAMDRGIDPSADRPSNTASLSQSHNGFQKTIGSEQDFYQDDKIQYAIRIYKKYGDEKAGDLEELSESRKIKFKAIDDVMSV